MWLVVDLHNGSEGVERTEGFPSKDASRMSKTESTPGKETSIRYITWPVKEEPPSPCFRLEELELRRTVKRPSIALC